MKTKLALSILAVTCTAAPIAMADGMGTMSPPPPAANSAPNAPNATTPPPANDVEAAYQAGLTAFNAQNYPEAIRQFRIVRRAAPSDGLANYALGLAYSRNSEPGEARSHLERSIRADNAPVGARAELGIVYLALNRRDDAVEQQAALSSALVDCGADCNADRRAQLQAALAELTRALEAPAAADPATTGWNFPSIEEGRAAYAEAVGEINQERYADALVSLARAQASVGPHPDVLNYMGFASRKLGRFDAALAYYGEALSLDPNHLGATEYLGELYIQMGQVERARTQLARLDQLCAYGCEQREELARWIETSAE